MSGSMDWDRQGKSRKTKKLIRKTPVKKPDETNYSYQPPKSRPGNRKSRKKVTLPYVRG
jgi:hypothetical protein